MPFTENTTLSGDDSEYEELQVTIIRTMHTEELIRLQAALVFEQEQLEQYRKLIGREVLRRVGNHEQI